MENKNPCPQKTSVHPKHSRIVQGGISYNPATKREILIFPTFLPLEHNETMLRLLFCRVVGFANPFKIKRADFPIIQCGTQIRIVGKVFHQTLTCPLFTGIGRTHHRTFLFTRTESNVADGRAGHCHRTVLTHKEVCGISKYGHMFSNSLRCHPFLVLIHHGKLGIGHLRVPGRQIRDILGLHFFLVPSANFRFTSGVPPLGIRASPANTVPSCNLISIGKSFTSRATSMAPATNWHDCKPAKAIKPKTKDQPTFFFHTLLVLNFLFISRIRHQ